MGGGEQIYSRSLRGYFQAIRHYLTTQPQENITNLLRENWISICVVLSIN